MIWSTDEEDAKMLLDIPSPMNNVISDPFTLELTDISLNNTRQKLCKLQCFVKILKTEQPKVDKI